jgi:hypothetical protein
MVCLSLLLAQPSEGRKIYVIMKSHLMLERVEMSTGALGSPCAKAVVLFGGTISGPNAKMTGCYPSANPYGNWYVVTLATFIFDERQRSTISTYHRLPRKVKRLFRIDYRRLGHSRSSRELVSSSLLPLLYAERRCPYDNLKSPLALSNQHQTRTVPLLRRQVEAILPTISGLFFHKRSTHDLTHRDLIRQFVDQRAR